MTSLSEGTPAYFPRPWNVIAARPLRGWRRRSRDRARSPAVNIRYSRPATPTVATNPSCRSHSSTFGPSSIPTAIRPIKPGTRTRSASTGPINTQPARSSRPISTLNKTWVASICLFLSDSPTGTAHARRSLSSSDDHAGRLCRDRSVLSTSASGFVFCLMRNIGQGGSS